MSDIKNSFSELVGNTPMYRAGNFMAQTGVNGTILAKLEYFNPSGSVKDRIAGAMVDEAEKSGKLKPGATIIEPTSGNTGIGLAALGAARGYKVILTMPENLSVERRNLLGAYGAELVLTPGSQGMTGAIAKANELAKTIEGSFIPGQFENSANPLAHYTTTGPEIWDQTGGNVDIFVASVGTGGTLTGAGKYLREKNPDIQLYAVEPAESPTLSTGRSGPNKIQGIGAGFVPEVLDTSLYDEVLCVRGDDAFETARIFIRSEGLFIGISSGATLHAVVELLKRPENHGKVVVALLPDTGDRYLSTPLVKR